MEDRVECWATVTSALDLDAFDTCTTHLHFAARHSGSEDAAETRLSEFKPVPPGVCWESLAFGTLRRTSEDNVQRLPSRCFTEDTSLLEGSNSSEGTEPTSASSRQERTPPTRMGLHPSPLRFPLLPSLWSPSHAALPRASMVSFIPRLCQTVPTHGCFRKKGKNKSPLQSDKRGTGRESRSGRGTWVAKL